MSSEKLYHECHEIVRQSKVMLEQLRDWGFTQLYAEAEPISVPEISTELGIPVTATVPVTKCKPPLTLSDLEASIKGCQQCALCQDRAHIVFGQGNPQAELVLVGEAPGREEDKQGIPFVGEAGQLLEKILFAMGLRREDVYICNVVKCRPPQNRDPLAEEIAACEQFLKRQLEIIKPRLIITLGRFAAHTLLQTDVPIGRLRGHWSEYQGVPLMPTYHPAYLLRNPAGKRDVWQDVKQVMQRLKQ